MKVEKLTTAVGEVGTRMTNIEEGKFTDPMKEAVREISQSQRTEINATALRKEEIEDMVNTRAKEQLAEAENRAKRNTNLIVFKVPESDKASGISKKQEDTEKVQSLLVECHVKHQPIEITRLGQPGGTTRGEVKTDRPIKITFESQKARDDTLSSLIKNKRDLLGKDSDSQLLTIGFRRDMTPKERKEEEELYKTLKQKREESKASGDDNARWVVRSGKVVNLKEWKAARKEEVWA